MEVAGGKELESFPRNRVGKSLSKCEGPAGTWDPLCSPGSICALAVRVFCTEAMNGRWLEERVGSRPQLSKQQCSHVPNVMFMFLQTWGRNLQT